MSYLPTVSLTLEPATKCLPAEGLCLMTLPLFFLVECFFVILPTLQWAALVHETGGLLKVIVEAGLLSPEETRRAASLAADGGADFVKTSTGVYGGGATAEQVRLLRSALPPTVGVKASGGISTLARALEMLEAGADRSRVDSKRR